MQLKNHCEESRDDSEAGGERLAGRGAWICCWRGTSSHVRRRWVLDAAHEESRSSWRFSVGWKMRIYIHRKMKWTWSKGVTVCAPSLVEEASLPLIAVSLLLCRWKQKDLNWRGQRANYKGVTPSSTPDGSVCHTEGLLHTDATTFFLLSMYIYWLVNQENKLLCIEPQPQRAQPWASVTHCTYPNPVYTMQTMQIGDTCRNEQ